MKLLIVSATDFEIADLRKNLLVPANHQVDYLVTGVGMIHTTFELTKCLMNYKYDLAINVGIAGAFDRSIAIGECVWVRKDLFSEMGAEDGEDFLSLIQLGLQTHDDFPFTWGELYPPIYKELNSLQKLKQVRSITVNKVHGKEESIMQTNMRLSPQIESMEGAAFFYVCMKMNTPCIQVRSISNYVERRNKENWNIPLALKNLRLNCQSILTELFV